VGRAAAAESDLAGLKQRVAALEEHNADLRALIMDLYSRTGTPYPRAASD
jgi:hypothetical protein